MSEEQQEEHKLTAEEFLALELKEHARVALECKEQINTAKTDVKKKYYKKKLAKNNTAAYQVMLALEEMGRNKKIDQSKEEQQADE